LTLLLSKFNEESIYAAGINDKWEQLTLTLLLGIIVAACIEVAGIMLIFDTYNSCC